MQYPPHDPKIPEQERASTGIPGLDHILGGGLPANHMYLVEGTPGAGKTTLGLQFLRRGVENGETGLYITLSETAAELKTVAASHGWSLDGVEIFELVTVAGLSPDSQQSILHPSEIELGETTRSVMAVAERVKPRRVVFDGLSEMRLLAQNPLRYRRQVLALKNFFAARGCTVVLLDDRSAQDDDLQLHSITHGAICLEQTVGQYGPERRSLRVIKMRGIPFSGGEHDFNLETGGLAVYPRLVAAEHQTGFASELASTGNVELDKLLGGGLSRGSNTLFSGPPGVGKTTTAIACVRAALLRGERVVYYMFDERLDTLLLRSTALGMELESYLKSGLLQIDTLDPAEVSPGEFANKVRTAVEIGDSRLVVLDGLHAYLQALSGDKHLLLQMYELLGYLNHRGVVTIVVVAQQGLFGNLSSDVDLSYLSDGIMAFRFFEARGCLLKAVSVVKSRTTDHELSIREFRLGASGVEVGHALTDFEGVLSGVAAYEGSLAILGDADASAA